MGGSPLPGVPIPPEGAENLAMGKAASQEQLSSGVIIPDQVAFEPVDPDELAAIRSLEERRKQKRRSKIIRIAVVCGILLLLVVLFAVANAVGEAMKNAQNRPEVVTVARDNITASVQASGTLEPASHVAINAEVSGIIQDVLVTEGQSVQAGDPLLTIKNAELDNSIATAGRALKHARKSLDDAKAGVSDAWGEYYQAINEYNSAVDEANSEASNAVNIANEAYANTYNAEIAEIPADASPAERDALIKKAQADAQAAYDEAYENALPASVGSFDHKSYLSSIDASETSAEYAEENLEDAQRAYDYAVEEASKRTVRAPVSGTVLNLKAVPGASVGWASGGTSVAADTLMYIADLSALNVSVEVNEIDIINVKAGQRVMATFDAIPNLELSGNVASVASTSTVLSGDSLISGGVVTFKVVAVINGPDSRLKPGMTTNVSILTREIPNVLAVPATAVEEDENGSYVMVALDDKATKTERRGVSVGERSGSKVEIVSGLTEGEMVLGNVSSDSSDASQKSSSSTK